MAYVNKTALMVADETEYICTDPPTDKQTQPIEDLLSGLPKNGCGDAAAGHAGQSSAANARADESDTKNRATDHCADPDPPLANRVNAERQSLPSIRWATLQHGTPK